jgi:hypothetical protein
VLRGFCMFVWQYIVRRHQYGPTSSHDMNLLIDTTLCVLQTIIFIVRAYYLSIICSVINIFIHSAVCLTTGP